MYTSSTDQIAQARIAGLDRQAPQDALARQGRQGRRPPKHPAGAAAAGLALVWALAACGSALASQARPLSPQHALQAGSQSQISDLANLKREAILAAAERARTR